MTLQRPVQLSAHAQCSPATPLPASPPPQVSDFGLSKLSSPYGTYCTQWAGSTGYMAPELMQVMADSASGPMAWVSAAAIRGR